MKWRRVSDQKPMAFREILFSDGEHIYAGWLETTDPTEDLLFIDTLSGHIESHDQITHWSELPKAPYE